MLLALWSPKGGSGTSVVSAAVALVAAGRGETRLADLGGDQPAILGLSLFPADLGVSDGLVGWLAGGPSSPTEWLDEMAVPVVPGLALLPRGPDDFARPSPEAGAALAVALRDGGAAVLDAGSGHDPGGAVRAAIEVADAALMVIRPCYLALRRAVGDPRLARSAGAILVEDPGRALDAADVAAVLGVPVVGRIPVRSEIARAVDAGVLRDRLPESPGHLRRRRPRPARRPGRRPLGRMSTVPQAADLDVLLADPDVSEILLNGGGGPSSSEPGGSSRSRSISTRPGCDGSSSGSSLRSGLRLDRSSPMVDARLPDGSRLHAVLPPVAVDGTCVAIRRFAAGGRRPCRLRA